MSGFWLKIIAMLTMLADHTATIIFSPMQPAYILFRFIGRLSFPIFCFCVSEGTRYTRSRKKYALRLFLFAIISEIPFNLGFFGNISAYGGQNVMFTFFFAVLGITMFEDNGIFDIFKTQSKKKNVAEIQTRAEFIARIFCLCLCATAAHFLNTDYGGLGVCIVYSFYFTREAGKTGSLLISGISLIMMSYIYAYVPGGGLVMFNFILQGAAVFALFFIALYNNKSGPGLKWLFYVFYPAHIFILYFISKYVITQKLF